METQADEGNSKYEVVERNKKDYTNCESALTFFWTFISPYIQYAK